MKNIPDQVLLKLGRKIVSNFLDSGLFTGLLVRFVKTLGKRKRQLLMKFIQLFFGDKY